MSGKRNKYSGFGTVSGVKRVLWRILRRAEDALDDTTIDDESCRNWANTAIQAALAYSKLHETHVLAQDMQRYEHLLEGNGHVR